MAKRELLLGDEALALGALHAGLSGVYAYPNRTSATLAGLPAGTGIEPDD